MRNTFFSRIILLLAFCWIPVIAAFGNGTQIVDFADIPLEPNSAWKGPVPEDVGEEFEDGFGNRIRHGMVTSGGVQFINRYNFAWQSWSGFAFSNSTDNTTPGFLNDTSAFTGGGAGDANYSVAFGYVLDLDPTNSAERDDLPYFELPDGYALDSVKVANTTYAALIMLEGDPNGFAKQFGGVTGADPDYFSLHIFGADDDGTLLEQSVNVPLADYRPTDPGQDFVLEEWLELDLSPLASARRVYFNFSSSDVGMFGINTPAYVALDDLVLRKLLSGDLDGDGEITAADMDAVRSAVAVGSNEPAPDLNEDGRVTYADVQVLLDASRRLAGDANWDGMVDFADFLSLSQQFEQQGSWSQGDFDCNGNISFADFLVLSEHFGESNSAALVPEPDGNLLAGITVVALGSLLRRRRRACRG